MTPEERSFEQYREHPTPDSLLSLLKAHQDRVYNLSYQVLRHAQDAEDAAQNALLKAARGAAAIADATGFRRWLYRITLTTALDVRSERNRRRARERAYAFSREVSEPAGADEVGPELYRALGALEEDLRDLVLRHYFEKSSLRQLAAAEGCSAAAVWKKIEKGKARLREELTTLGGRSAGFALEGVLGSMHPMKAPAALVGPSLTAGLGVSSTAPLSGGIMMATKGSAVGKLVASLVLVATLGLGGGFAAGLSRGRSEAREAEDRRNDLSKELAGARNEITRLRGALSKAVPAPAAGSPPAVKAPAAKASGAPETPEASENRARKDLRENLRKLLRMAMAVRKAGRAELSTSDPEMADPELQKAMMALMPYLLASQDPAREPEKFAELIGTAREVLMEELGFDLSASQRETLKASSGRIRDVLEHSRNAPLSERGIARLEAEREFTIGLRDAITPDQWAQWSTSQGMSLLSSPTSDSTSFKIVSSPEDAVSVAKGWTARYRLDEAQQVAVQSSARLFVDSVIRLDQEFSAASGDAASQGTVPSLATQVTAYDYRIRILRAQLDTLGQLQGLVGPEAGARIRNTAPAEIVGSGLSRTFAGSVKK